MLKSKLPGYEKEKEVPVTVPPPASVGGGPTTEVPLSPPLASEKSGPSPHPNPSKKERKKGDKGGAANGHVNKEKDVGGPVCGEEEVVHVFTRR